MVYYASRKRLQEYLIVIGNLLPQETQLNFIGIRIRKSERSKEEQKGCCNTDFPFIPLSPAPSIQ